MLVELTIRNIALIESLRIEFAQGFNVLTGETGAGKSIVVDSISLALGGRADVAAVEVSLQEKKAVVTLKQDASAEDLMATVKEAGYTPLRVE
jgi:DNA repair protein RecN (Recombination protein N)